MSYRSVFHPDLFRDHVALVTGGGSGIGRCTAHELSALGAKVILLGRSRDKLDAVAAEIRSEGGAVDSRVQDIRHEAGVKAAVADLLEAHGRIDALVNNAGGQFPSPLSHISQKGFETVVRANLVGGFLMAREVYNQGMSKTGGAIVNILADMWGGMPGMGHSGAARAGMLNFTETAAVEWAASGVRVNAVAPGWVASSGLDTYEDPGMKAMIPKLREQVPLKRLATEAEVSAAICFLLSDAAAFISGDCIKVDGGASLNTKLYPLADHDRSRPFEGFHLARKPRVLDGGD